MKVWRLERDGLGPYRNRDYNRELYRELDDYHSKIRRRTHPTPFQSNLIGFSDPKSFLCSFNSERALKRWFYGFLTRLKSHGFKIKVYELQTPVNSNEWGQCVFFPEQIIKEIKE